MHPSTYLLPHKDLFKFKITTDTDQKAICKQGPVTLRVTEIQVPDPLTMNGYGSDMDPGQSRAQLSLSPRLPNHWLLGCLIH